MTEEVMEYRTKNLALATYLACMDVDALRLEMVGNEAAWVFVDDQSLRTLRNTFFDGEAAVNPAKYQRVSSEVRKSLYDFLDSHTVV